jgi:hypothetical protein
MQLWTHHPPVVRLDDPTFKLDHTKGEYWNASRQKLREGYRKALPRLQAQLESDQLLWCCTARNQYELVMERERIEWELNVRFDLLIFCRTSVWDAIIHDGIEWDDLFVEFNDEPEAIAADDITALVRWPVEGCKPERRRDMLAEFRERDKHYTRKREKWAATKRDRGY